jgi:hypothetical protein
MTNIWDYTTAVPSVFGLRVTAASCYNVQATGIVVGWGSGDQEVLDHLSRQSITLPTLGSTTTPAPICSTTTTTSRSGGNYNSGDDSGDDIASKVIGRLIWRWLGPVLAVGGLFVIAIIIAICRCCRR